MPYIYDANGNLLDDGQNEYVYDSANRLSSVNGTSLYSYNGLGDRLSQTVDGQVTNYTLDLNAGLTQVLSDGTTTYTYGLGRISQQSENAPEYFLGDALGSVRQLTNQAGEVTSAKSYDPYGVVTQTSGSSHTDYGFTGESYDTYIKLIDLRSRMYSPVTGRFTSKDSWLGDYNRPLSLNRWNYVEGNPVNFVDPSGHCKKPEAQDQACWDLLRQIETTYPFIDLETGLSATNYWTETELLTIEEELGFLDQASAIDLNQEFATKEIRVDRERLVKGKYCATFPSGFDRWYYNDRTIRVYDTYYNGGCEGAFVHELAHYWDFRDNLADPFMTYVGSYYSWIFWYKTCEDEPPPKYNGTLNAHEDFAESLSEYVLLYTNHAGDAIGIKAGEARWYFIESLLNTGDILTPPE